MTDHVEVRRGAYHDSVSLMQVSGRVASAPGVTAAQVAMATELNVAVIVGMGFAVPDAASPNDLVVAIRGDDDAVAAGLQALDATLAGLRRAGTQAGGFGEEPPPRTLGSAVARSGANLALVSVPGPYATAEALDAIAHGVSVMVFSDNVSVEDEVLLKDTAARGGVLVMGPDCGTAVVGGVALGFANVLSRGPVGLVAASGTGAQQVMALLDAAGVGVSHCLGVGGRDLSAAVGGRSTRQALAALATDESTESVVVVSKPPAPEVLADLERYAARLGKPVHWATLGAGRPDLTAAVESALTGVGRPVPAAWPRWRPVTEDVETAIEDVEIAGRTGPSSPPPPRLRGRFLRGLFCGGTLADEAMLIASGELGGIRSNIPLAPQLALAGDLCAEDHVVIDFGDDRLTRGRAHPMIDPRLRLDRIAVEAADPTCGVLLLDLVLGYGSHPDPAPELAAAVRAARQAARSQGRELPVVVSLTGTQGDPQGTSASAAALSAAGAAVFLSNAEATREAIALLRPRDHADAHPGAANRDEANPDEANPEQSNPHEANADEANPDGADRDEARS